MRLSHEYDDRVVELSMWLVDAFSGDPAGLERAGAQMGLLLGRWGMRTFSKLMRLLWRRCRGFEGASFVVGIRTCPTVAPPGRPVSRAKP